MTPVDTEHNTNITSSQLPVELGQNVSMSAMLGTGKLLHMYFCQSLPKLHRKA